jgi:hypothetical protein
MMRPGTPPEDIPPMTRGFQRTRSIQFVPRHTGEHMATPDKPAPSEIHPAAIICVRVAALVVNRWFGAAPSPLL